MKNLLKITTLFALIYTLACSKKNQETATLILKNAQFFTAENDEKTVSAIAVRGDRIVFVGDEKDVEKWVGDSTKIMDLQGAFVMPGFIEGHGHYENLGRSLLTIKLLDTKSWDEIVGRVAEKLPTAKPGEWLEGRGWHQEKWSVLPEKTAGGYPFHDQLSAISPDNPVVLFHASGHSLLANKKAMDVAGISAETRDPVGGRIVRDGGGKPIGVFEENAMELITAPFAAFQNQKSEAEKRAFFDRCIAEAGKLCREKGITSFQDAGSNFWELGQYQRLAEAGKLEQRLWAMISQPQKHDFSKLAAFPKIGLGNNFLTVRSVKCYLDGALGSYGAWLLQPYSDKANFFGQNTTPIDSIRAVAVECRKNNLQCCVHAIGDRGNREMLDLFEKSFENGDGKNFRWRIEHAQHIDVQDIPRFGKLGVVASMQAIHCTSDAPFVVKRLGKERARTGAYPWRSLLDSGAHLANGTDAPVEDVDPLPCIYASVTRKRADSGFEFFPEQKMTRREALLSYTIWNAWAAFEENEKGSLAVGKLADFVILDKNLLTCQPEEILKTKVLKTIVGGVEKWKL